MTNTNTFNYFVNFSKETNMLLGIGRYFVFAHYRSKLPNRGVQDLMGSFIEEYLHEHIRISRAFYAGTPLYPVAPWKSRPSFEFKAFYDAVPTDYTSGVQLYSCSGSCRPITWTELLLYYKVGSQFVAQRAGSYRL